MVDAKVLQYHASMTKVLGVPGYHGLILQPSIFTLYYPRNENTRKII